MPNQQASERWYVATICVGIVLLLQTAIIRYIIPQITTFTDYVTVGSILASTALYGTIFKLALYIYDNYLWSRLNRSLAIAGVWQHRMLTADGERSGVTEIRQTAYAIEISGKNFETDENSPVRSVWWATSVWLDGHQLWFTYEGHREGTDQSSHKSGLVKAILEGTTGCVRITGVYYDAAPSPATGRVSWARVESPAK